MNTDFHNIISNIDVDVSVEFKSGHEFVSENIQVLFYKVNLTSNKVNQLSSIKITMSPDIKKISLNWKVTDPNSKLLAITDANNEVKEIIETSPNKKIYAKFYAACGSRLRRGRFYQECGEKIMIQKNNNMS
jgi:hypothetical protein